MCQSCFRRIDSFLHISWEARDLFALSSWLTFSQLQCRTFQSGRFYQDTPPLYKGDTLTQRAPRVVLSLYNIWQTAPLKIPSPVRCLHPKTFCRFLGGGVRGGVANYLSVMTLQDHSDYIKPESESPCMSHKSRWGDFFKGEIHMAWVF